MGEKKFKTYLYSYGFQGQRWNFEVKAASQPESMARLKHIANADYDGELMISVPCGWLERIRMWWKA